MEASTSSSVTIEDIDMLLSGATPQFAMQLKPRLWAMIEGLPWGNEVRAYGEQQMVLLDRIALGTTRGTGGPGRPPADDPGWREIPSHP